MTPTHTLRRAEPDDAATVALLVATAFGDLDVCTWLVPDDAERARILPRYFSIVVDHAVTHGTVEVTADYSAAAVWLTAPFPDIPDYDTRLAAVCGRWTPRFRTLDEQMHHAHPHDVPHEYLAFLAVAPAQQGRGAGTALLEHHHTILDAQRRPVYLEASNSRSRNLYTRHGYLDRAAPLDLPYHGEPMYPMWRAQT
jgi:ribosomal protein S18 acetylase RimI-like enzyme